MIKIKIKKENDKYIIEGTKEEYEYYNNEIKEQFKDFLGEKQFDDILEGKQFEDCLAFLLYVIENYKLEYLRKNVNYKKIETITFI